MEPAHTQVTAAALYILHAFAYQAYLESLEPNDDKMNFKTWSRTNTNNIPQFQYWALVLEMGVPAWN